MIDILNKCVPENAIGTLDSLLTEVNFDEVENILDGITSFEKF